MFTPTITKTVQEARTVQELRACFPVITQLRPHLTEETFLAQVQRQIALGYHLLYLSEEMEDTIEIVSLLGYRIQEYLAWGKILYIDDLITESSATQKGYATQLMDWTLEHAVAQGCAQIHLDSGLYRHTAHRLYLNQGFAINSYHFSKSTNVTS